MRGTNDKIKGRVKEAFGALTDDQRLKDEGKLDQATGKVKGAVERMIDKAECCKGQRAKIVDVCGYPVSRVLEALGAHLGGGPLGQAVLRVTIGNALTSGSERRHREFLWSFGRS